MDIFCDCCKKKPEDESEALLGSGVQRKQTQNEQEHFGVIGHRLYRFLVKIQSEMQSIGGGKEKCFRFRVQRPDH
eukprot:664831-Amphidinium_carterae.1